MKKCTILILYILITFFFVFGSINALEIMRRKDFVKPLITNDYRPQEVNSLLEEKLKQDEENSLKMAEIVGKEDLDIPKIEKPSLYESIIQKRPIEITHLREKEGNYVPKINQEQILNEDKLTKVNQEDLKQSSQKEFEEMISSIFGIEFPKNILENNPKLYNDNTKENNIYDDDNLSLLEDDSEIITRRRTKSHKSLKRKIKEILNNKKIEKKLQKIYKKSYLNSPSKSDNKKMKKQLKKKITRILNGLESPKEKITKGILSTLLQKPLRKLIKKIVNKFK